MAFKLYSHGSPQVVDALEAGSAFAAGDLVKFNGSGQIVLATAGIIGGIAKRAATTVANTKHEIELLDPNALYIAPAKDGAGADAATAQANVGEAFDVDWTTGAQGVDCGHVAAKEVYIVGIYPGEVTVSGGRYIVRFSTTKTFDDGQA